MNLDPLTLQIIFRLTLAAILGMCIGFEREWRGKPAGLRTYMLVAIGAALFTSASVVLYYLFPSVNGVRGFDYHLIANIVVGIGFIGGGLIVLRGGHMEGLTTAAGLWTTAAIGMASGLGLYIIAVYTTVLVLFVLLVLRVFENRLHESIGNK